MEPTPNDFESLSKHSKMQRFLKGVEWLGNLLPHPAFYLYGCQ